MEVDAFSGTEQSYVEGYAVFLQQAQNDWAAAVAAMEEHLREPLAGAGTVSTLSVGCGDGAFDSLVLSLLRRLTPDARRRYLAIDVNTEYLEQFRVMAGGADGRGFEFDVREASMVDFTSDEKFDVIHFMHSLYYVPGREAEILDRARAMLTDRGRMFLVIQSGHSAVRRLTQRFQELVGSYSRDNSLSSTQLGEILDRIGQPHHTVALPFTVDTTPCYDLGSADGRRLLGFLCQANLMDAPADLMQAMLDALTLELADFGHGRHLRLDTVAFVVDAHRRVARGSVAGHSVP